MLFLAVGSFGAGVARSVPELLIWRIVQAFGASSGLSVGMGVMADIYRLEERGRSSGLFFGVSIFLGRSVTRTDIGP
jgi:MFS family permease